MPASATRRPAGGAEGPAGGDAILDGERQVGEGGAPGDEELSDRLGAGGRAGRGGVVDAVRGGQGGEGGEVAAAQALLDEAPHAGAVNVCAYGLPCASTRATSPLYQALGGAK